MLGGLLSDIQTMNKLTTKIRNHSVAKLIREAKTTNQMTNDQVRTIMKNGWFSGLDSNWNTSMQTRNREKKMNEEIMKRIMTENKIIVFSVEPGLEDSQVQKRKRKPLIDKYPNKQYHGIKWFNIYRRKISLGKNWASSKDHKQKVKTQRGIQIRFADKTTTTSKSTKIEFEIYLSDEAESTNQND